MFNKSITEFWPNVMPDNPPRKSQVEAFNWLDSLEPHIKYILLEMPVGGGKSPLGLAVSTWMKQNKWGESFILTPQKILQKQYEDSFSDQLLASMYGKANYKCHGKDTNCEVGSLIKPRCGSCTHRSAFGKAKRTPNLVLNYKLGMLYFEYAMHYDGAPFEPRQLMIMDECHNLEHHLISHTEVTLSEWMCKKLKLPIKFSVPEVLEDAVKWIKETYLSALKSYLIDLDEEVRCLKQDIERKSLEMGVEIPIDKYTEGKIKELNKTSRHMDMIVSLLVDISRCEHPDRVYVLVPDYKKFHIKHLYARTAFNNVIKPAAEKFLFMSSTILNKDEFCEDLGIDSDKTAFLSLKSEFPIENRPVLYTPKCKMSYGWDTDKHAGERKKMVNAIIEILNVHENDSGIIHTGSFKISEWLIKEIDSYIPHKILNHNPIKDVKVSRDDIIAEYVKNAEDHPTVLISPSITEGLDLKDDLGRFAIFAKVPFPSLGDAWIKRRMELSKGWYHRQALTEMIQGSGRVCRTPEDFGITYILDTSFGYLYQQTRKNYIPKWWDEAMDSG